MHSRQPWRFTRPLGMLGLALGAVWPLGTHAQSGDPADTAGSLAPVEVRSRSASMLGSSDAASQGSAGREQIERRPVSRTADLLELVPGLIVTQHSGDGKAAQYFLRGVNLDHGTDFAVSVNGVPVNLPTHAHGQGYSDLNFLIPELVQRIDYRKGPYFAADGDFASAGSADFIYRSQLDQGLARLTVGPNGYARALAADAFAAPSGARLLAAVERMNHDGPWQVAEGLRKTNSVLTLSDRSGDMRWSVSLMNYQARWTATDQIPERLLRAGLYQGRSFSLFDSLDPSDGGSTERHSLSGQWQHSRDGVTDRVTAYGIRYRFDLFSNFTYALDRPDTGDQFNQRDQRTVYGLRASRQWQHEGDRGIGWIHTIGLQTRTDRIRLGLVDSAQRQPIAVVRDDVIDQTHLGLYGESQAIWADWLRSSIGLRLDQMRAQVRSLTLADNSGQSESHRLSPKFSSVLGPWRASELFFNAGRGFHSNDARGTTVRRSPRDPLALVAPVPGLVGSRGQEIGFRTEALSGLRSSLSVWRLDFDSELTYLGDTGTTQAGRPSRRTGIEWSNRWAGTRQWLIDADFAWSRPRYADAAAEGNRIPNALRRSASLSIQRRDLMQWDASLGLRYVGSAALIEDGSVKSRASVLANLRLHRSLSGGLELDLDLLNVLDRRFNDIEYWYASRLRGESGAFADRHLHPGEPRALRATLSARF